jgi:hypothetical protein
VVPLAWVAAIALLAGGGALVWQVRRLLARLDGRADKAEGNASPSTADLPAAEGGAA